MNKSTLRSVYLEKRLGLSDREYQSRNAQLLNHTQALIEQHSSRIHIHTFLAMEEQKEPSTLQLLPILWARHNTKVYSSKTHFAERRLSHHLISELSDVQRDERGIPFPIQPEEFPATTMDLVFVPLISFDRKGNRIGYGAGLYDRFLSQLQPDCLKIGLSLSPPLDHIPYKETHDIPLDQCITPLGIYAFGNSQQ